MVFKVSYIVGIIWHGTCSLRCTVRHKPDSLPNFCPPNFRWRGWFPSWRLNNLRVRGDTWTAPSGTQMTGWRVFHLFYQAKESSPGCLSATGKCDDRMGWSAVDFQHLTMSTPVYKDRWLSSHISVMTCISGEPPPTLPGVATHPPSQRTETKGTGAAPMTKCSLSHFAEDVYKSLGTGMANMPCPLDYVRRWAHPNSPVWEADLCFLWELFTLSWKPSDLLMERRAGHFLRRVQHTSHFWIS